MGSCLFEKQGGCRTEIGEGPAFEYMWVNIYIYTTSEKPVNDQSYGVLDRYGITILYK
jgi:hypothetical protein